MSDVIDESIWKEAQEWATDICDQFAQARQDPTKGLEGESERIYKELVAFNWFNILPDFNDQKEATIKHLAIIKYGKIKWARDNKKQAKPKKTAWEHVAGKARRKKR